MNVSENDRARRRREARRRAQRNDLIAVGVLIVAVIVAVICVSCAVANADTEGGNTALTTRATTRTTSSSSSVTTTTTGATGSTGEGDVTTGSSSAVTTTTRKPVDTTIDTTGRYIQPAGADWNLVLVNDWNPMPDDLEEKMTLTVINSSVQNSSVDSRIADALWDMVNACRAAGGSIWAQSMYRPYDVQEALFNREVAKYINQGMSRAEAEAEANVWVKRPGYSEHNTGLAVDFNSCSHEFTGTFAHKWLVEHCAEYGFILRFPEGKEHITGVTYESWHYRYVGEKAAVEIMEKGLTLEEYCEMYSL